MPLHPIEKSQKKLAKMDSPSRVRGGYDYQFVEEPPHGLKCVICLAVTRQPQQHGECGKLFCSSCITEYRETSFVFPKCPHCRQHLETFNDGKSAQDVMTLKVKCENQPNGCAWEGELYSIEDHMKRCDHAILLCPNKCESNQEITKLQRGQLETHINTECPRRQYKCPYCEEMGEYEERMNLHLNRCPKVTLECTNEECGERVLRCEMERHKSECEFQRTSCKFARFGCDHELPKRELKTHEDDEGLHLQSTKEKVLELMDQLEKQEVKFTEEIKQQENKINSLTAAPPNKAKTFELTKYRKYKVGNKPFHSPSFYSSSKGYRLSISVNTNGLDGGEDTHVSVYAHVERGVNDDSLTWPFQGSVIIELLNQLEDKNHKQYTIKFPQDEEVSGRVTGMVRKRGWGTTHFIAHRHLGHKSRKNCQYLKDNKLVFRVATQLPEYKPWLECDM